MAARIDNAGRMPSRFISALHLSQLRKTSFLFAIVGGLFASSDAITSAPNIPIRRQQKLAPGGVRICGRSVSLGEQAPGQTHQD
jgi:hypothetical protein